MQKRGASVHVEKPVFTHPAANASFLTILEKAPDPRGASPNFSYSLTQTISGESIRLSQKVCSLRETASFFHVCAIYDLLHFVTHVYPNEFKTWPIDGFKAPKIDDRIRHKALNLKKINLHPPKKANRTRKLLTSG